MSIPPLAFTPFVVFLPSLLHSTQPYYLADYTVLTQLTILSFASFLGRIAGGAVVNRFGVFNVIIVCTFCSTVILFGMLGVVSVAGIVIFSLLYGFFSGACASRLSSLCLCRPSPLRDLRQTSPSLDLCWLPLPRMLQRLGMRLSRLSLCATYMYHYEFQSTHGYRLHLHRLAIFCRSPFPPPLISLYFILFFRTGLGSLISDSRSSTILFAPTINLICPLSGTPIVGALLTRDFIWWRPVLYCGVGYSLRGHSPSSFHLPQLRHFSTGHFRSWNRALCCLPCHDW